MASKSKNRSTLLQLFIFLSLGIALIYWQYTAMGADDLQRMLEAIKAVNWAWLFPIVIIGFLSHYYRALRWKLLLAPLGITTSTTNTVLAVLIGYLTNSLIPRAGEVARCTVLAKYEDAPADKLIGTIVAERAFDFLCLLLLAAATIILQYDIIYPYVADLGQAVARRFFPDGSGATRYLLAAIIFLVIIAAFIWMYKKIRHSKVGHVIKGIGEGLKAIVLVRQKGRFIVYTLAIWFCYTFILNIAFWAMPALHGIHPLASLSIVVFGSVAMIATPGGIGAYPPIVAGILLAYGLAFPEGNAFGWLSWMVQTGMVLSMGLAALIILPLYNRKRHGQNSAGK